MNACEVCQEAAPPRATLCKRCRKLVNRVDTRGRANTQARIAALKRAWDGRAFRCYYTGAALDDTDPSDPRYLSFDHTTPRKGEDVVAAARCINDMKSDMSEDEFRNIVIQLASRFQGGESDAGVLNLKHWRR